MEIRARLTFANVVSCLALFVALGGSSYAAVKIKKNSVGSTQIKNNSVRSKDVRNKSLLAKDFKSGQLHAGARGATGFPGPRGATGSRGPTGPAGAARGYAHVYHHALVPADTRGVAGMVVGCSSTHAVTCTSAPAEGSLDQSISQYCFKLSFRPSSIQITPDEGTTSGDPEFRATRWSASVPAHTLAGNHDGCPPGYLSADASADRGPGSTQFVTGFWITFN